MTSLMATIAQEHREQIADALAFACGADGLPSHTVDDVVAMIEEGRAQCWPGACSVIVTEIIEHPQRRILHFFLAGGVMKELEAMTPLILQWGVAQGCTAATLIGRKGWHRSFLARSGWTTNESILMEKLL